MSPVQLALFEYPPPVGTAQLVGDNPFTHVQGANLFGLRAVYTGFCACTEGFLTRPGYSGDLA